MSFSNLLMKNSINGSLRSTQTAALLLLNVSTRQGHTLRGKPPGVARTLEQRLQDENVTDAEIVARVNIGFPQLKPSRSAQLKARLEHLKAQRASKELEQLARGNKLLIDLDKVQESYVQRTGQHDLRLLADHYGIFEHLFGSAYFVPRVPLTIRYELNADTLSPVYNGNVIKPSEASKAPLVSFDGQLDPVTGKAAQGDSYWTLLATNPDAHFTNPAAECLHWFIANIPNGKIGEGEVLADYLPPFPPRGLGYQRMVFVLYKQESRLDLSSHKLDAKDYNNLEKRTFSTLDFYRQHQDELTPAGLAFYQTNWDESLTNFYHNVLQLKEPIYEYDFPKPYLADQKFFPLKQAFNLYMDKHRDIKEINKEYLQRKLAKTHPFEGPEKPLRFPNAHPLRDVPSWLKTEIRKRRLGTGRVQDY
ncbi:PREDICTED: 39S ribosomal protein L38, mitochondrial [Drosophila arizonae]|uniref:Large ribosomal subunit protein mL38 n=1 Tax=Drosophila arizonae TaxID=7263 RepID=A0ABM1PTS5_DROAR|nr:PREDICTED: 39S ribosomal protein L38, mitochondrial [Drosophila arizonae]XP_017870613.1 PREDICTED: 39S ribosomal protein L38, mitochondrial [Drosophila arizonae]